MFNLTLAVFGLFEIDVDRPRFHSGGPVEHHKSAPESTPANSTIIARRPGNFEMAAATLHRTPAGRSRCTRPTAGGTTCFSVTALHIAHMWPLLATNGDGQASAGNFHVLPTWQYSNCLGAVWGQAVGAFLFSVPASGHQQPILHSTDRMTKLFAKVVFPAFCYHSSTVLPVHESYIVGVKLTGLQQPIVTYFGPSPEMHQSRNPKRLGYLFSRLLFATPVVRPIHPESHTRDTATSFVVGTMMLQWH
ncbi:hypothetical protein PG985_007976 [Apiospora marii]|uniref:uncharacterized protein n=1 Tax=Apiospora marii TaxID=335849 RepID=UPI00312F77E2